MEISESNNRSLIMVKTCYKEYLIDYKYKGVQKIDP